MKQRVYILDYELCEVIYDGDRVTDRNKFKELAAIRGSIKSIEEFEELFNQGLIDEDSLMIIDY